MTTLGISNNKDYPSKSKTYGEEKTGPGFKPEARSAEYAQVTNSNDYGNKSHSSFSGHVATSNVGGGFKATPRSAEYAQVTNSLDYDKRPMNYNDFGSESDGPDVMRKPKVL